MSLPTRPIQFGRVARPRRRAAITAMAGLAVSGAAAVVFATPASAAVQYLSPSWTAHPAAEVSQSSPVPVTINGQANVVVGDSAGNLHAYQLSNGAVTWQRGTSHSSILAPLSTNGAAIFTGLSSSAATTSTLGAYRATTGATLWGARNCAHCLQLSGPTLSGGALATGGPTAQLASLSAASGAQYWNFTNSDTTNSTPAVADLFGTGQPDWIFTTDQTPNAGTRPPAVSGGHLRILTEHGQAICSANFGGGPASPGSFDSSPALVSFGTSDLIVFGTGESGSNPDRILVYNDACQNVWTSPELAGTTIGAPSVADVTGTGEPIVLEEVANAAGHPVVYEIDIRGHRILRSTTISACNNFRPGTSSSIATADLQDKGYQDLVVPGGECGAYILDGKTLGVLGAVGLSCGLQNTPVLTDDGSGRVGITVAGYSGTVGGGTEGCVEHVEVAGASLGSLGWPEFHHDPKLSGLLTQTIPKHDAMTNGQVLGAGRTLTASADGYSATMVSDGHLGLYNSRGQLLWVSVLTSAGSRLVLNNTSLRIVTPTGAIAQQLWADGRNTAPLEFVVQANGYLALYRAGTTPWSPNVVLWDAR